MSLVRFAAFEIDRSEGVLRKQGRQVHLAAQPLKLLLVLLERPGRIVTRDELRRALWGETTFVEFDRGLNYCVSSLRTALGDSARHPRFIETVPRRGYRFLADVHVVEHASVTVPTPARWRWRWGSVAAAMMLVSQAPVILRAHTRQTATPAALEAFDGGLRAFDEGDNGRERSLELFARAIRLDGRFAEAYYALADTYTHLEGRFNDRRTNWRSVRDLASRALALEEMPSTHLLIASIALERDWAWREAESHIRRAIALVPQSDVALAGYARLLSAEGRDGEAVAAIRRAIALNGCELMSLDAAQVLYRARRYSEALDAIATAAKAAPPATAYGNEWVSKLDEAAAFVRAAQNEWRGRSARRRFSAAATALQRSAIRGDSSAARIAVFHAAAGESADALAWLERAALDRDPSLVVELRNPAFDLVRGSARFASIERAVRADLTVRAPNEAPGARLWRAR